MPVRPRYRDTGSYLPIETVPTKEGRRSSWRSRFYFGLARECVIGPGEAAIAKAQTEAYMLGSDVASITNMITAPLTTSIKLNEKDQQKFDDFKKECWSQKGSSKR